MKIQSKFDQFTQQNPIYDKISVKIQLDFDKLR
ncbi:MAG: hypothetical protein K0S24_1422 [Sphingobacterium sp.]|jgi:hypothetical protein|nr:hypothetical protein [Sphingobacterium sp.]